MIIQISQPEFLNERGKRNNNEDSIFPLNPTAQETLFVVCDGVGGAAKGEVASQQVAQTVYDYIKKYFKGFTTETDAMMLVHGAVEAAEMVLNQYITQNPTAKGMGTTLTLLHLHEGGATIAHVGDSRIYHVRKEAYPFVTEDHSLVNDLVRSGLLTREESYSHSQRNVITRAIQGAAQKPARADVQIITDIQGGDFFFLCTDGICEAWDDDSLTETLTLPYTTFAKLRSIQERCEADSHDNYSCYLIPIAAVEDPIIGKSHFPTSVEGVTSVVGTPRLMESFEQDRGVTLIPNLNQNVPPIPPVIPQIADNQSVVTNDATVKPEPPKTFWQKPVAKWVMGGSFAALISMGAGVWFAQKKQDLPQPPVQSNSVQSAPKPPPAQTTTTNSGGTAPEVSMPISADGLGEPAKEKKKEKDSVKVTPTKTLTVTLTNGKVKLESKPKVPNQPSGNVTIKQAEVAQPALKKLSTDSLRRDSIRRGLIISEDAQIKTQDIPK